MSLSGSLFGIAKTIYIFRKKRVILKEPFTTFADDLSLYTLTDFFEACKVGDIHKMKNCVFIGIKVDAVETL